MNKLFYVFLFTFAAAPLCAAVSTCETRVDKNLDKSTSEKVDYCLTDEIVLDDAPATEVILSDTYSVQYPKPKNKKPANAQQVTKIYSTAPISREYIDRDDYPAFRNDVLPNMDTESAHEAALEALRAQTPAKNVQKAAKKSAVKPARKTKETAKPKAQNTQTHEAEIKEAQSLQNDPLYQNNTDGGTTPPGFLDGGVMGPEGFGYNATDPAFQP